MSYEVKFPLTPPSDLRERGRVRGHLKLVLGNYLGFGIWDLEFK